MIDVVMRIEKTTKGAVRYIECDMEGRIIEKDYKIGTLYMRKSAFANGAPELIVVHIKPVQK